LAGRLRECRRVELERVGGDNFEALGISRRKLAQRCKAAPVAFNRDDPAGAAAQQGPRQTARTSADLEDRRMVEPTRRPGNPTGQVEVEQEILPEALVSDDAAARDDFAQWRVGAFRRLGQEGCGGVAQIATAPPAALSPAPCHAPITLSAAATPRAAIAKAAA